MNLAIVTDVPLNIDIQSLCHDVGPDAFCTVKLCANAQAALDVVTNLDNDILFMTSSFLDDAFSSSRKNKNGRLKWIVGLQDICEDFIIIPPANEVMAYSDLNTTTIRKTLLLVMAREQLDQMLKWHYLQFAKLEKLALLGELSASIVHDISNPLTILSGLASQLKSTIEDNRLVNPQDILKLEKNAQRLVNIVKTFRKMIVQQDSQNSFLFNLKDVFIELQDVVETSMSAKGIRFDINWLAVQEVSVLGQPQAVLQALLNLILNSIEAIASLPEKWIRLEVSETETDIKISVIDSGLGLPQGVIETIRKPLLSHKHGPKNMGIGLAIAQRVVQSHFGKLEIDTTSVHTKFDITLSKLLKQHTDKNRSLSFLVVDDHEDIADMIAHELRLRGCQATTATNLQTAVEYIEAHQPTAVITDVLMPGGSGIDIYRWQKQHRPELQIFFITGHALTLLNELKVIHDETVYTKPFNPSDLADAVLKRVLAQSPKAQVAVKIK